MTKEPITVGINITLDDLAEVFGQNKISSFPVKDDRGTVVGVISEVNVVKALLRRHSQPSKKTLNEYQDLLTPITTVTENESLNEVVKCILRNDCHRAYVIGGERVTLVGVISPKDVIRIISGRGQSKVDQSEMAAKYKKAIEDLHEVEAKLDRYEKIVSDSPLMMHSVDRQGTIRMANKAVHKILNYKNGELIGKTIFDLYPHQMHKAVREGLDHILESGYHQLVETMMVTQDKELVKVEVVSTSIKDDTGIRSGTITIGRVIDKEALVKALQQVAGNWASHYESDAG